MVKKLAATGAVPGFADTGRQVFPLGALQILQAAPTCALSALPGPEVAVLRTDAASEAAKGEGRTWMGYRADLPSDQLLPALSGWWRCDPARVAAGGLLVVTVAEFVVAVLADLDEWQPNGGIRQQLRYCFTRARLAGWLTDVTDPASASFLPGQDPAEHALVGPLLGTRLPSVSGGPIAYVAAGPAFREPSGRLDGGVT